MKTMIRTFKELSRLPTFEERYAYLRMNGAVGKETFGFDRILNQKFYTSAEWKRIRDFVIVRDNGCDLGAEGHEIYGKILIHHMNPISLDDLAAHSDILLDPENLICTTHETHNAIHYGSFDLVRPFEEIERRPFDTAPWRNT